MTEEEFLKKVKWTGIFCLVVGILMALATILYFVVGNIFTSIYSIICIILLALFYALTKSRKIAGPIIGIIVGALYILSFNIISIVIGIFIIIDCASMISYINANKAQ